MQHIYELNHYNNGVDRLAIVPNTHRYESFRDSVYESGEFILSCFRLPTFSQFVWGMLIANSVLLAVFAFVMAYLVMFWS